MDVLCDQTSLAHATSVRSCEWVDGRRTVLEFGRNETGSPSLEHQRMFLQTLNIEAKEAFLVKQIHSDRVYVLSDPQTRPADVSMLEADALITHLTDRPIAVLTADCLPVVLYDRRRHVAGAVHAGRQGTLERITSKAVMSMRREYGSSPEDILVGFGPAIGGCCYEVGADCIEPFRKEYPEWEQFSTECGNGKFMLDINQANEQDAREAGIPLGNIIRSGQCTCCETERFFSYRRDGTKGRMMTLVMLRSR